QGLAREIVARYAAREKKRGRKCLILTCLPAKVAMYEKMGFENAGISASLWGREQWYEMSMTL
ncbi:MAG: GNAT family N-acetyltransferase, partial [Lachnospiraceae bacterium]|nr:GNAT family N-acetyltransferase [Lachnospiraceae bacterium]